MFIEDVDCLYGTHGDEYSPLNTNRGEEDDLYSVCCSERCISRDM